MKQNLCARCGKRPAVVFIQRVEGDEVKPEGLCINCARDLNIGPIRQMIESSASATRISKLRPSR